MAGSTVNLGRGMKIRERKHEGKEIVYVYMYILSSAAGEVGRDQVIPVWERHAEGKLSVPGPGGGRGGRLDPIYPGSEWDSGV